MMQAPTIRSMTTEEIDSFVSSEGFGVLALAEGNHAFGVPLFYGARDDILYFQTRAGRKSHYLYATTEACLVVSSARPGGGWTSVQIVGRLERVAAGEGSAARKALARVPPPPPWSGEDADGPVTTFRLVPARRVGGSVDT